MNTAEHNRMSEYLQSCRWFRGRGWPVVGVTLVDHVRSNELDPRLDRRSSLGGSEVSYQLGTPERYVLAMAFTEDGELRPAIEDAAFAHSLLALIRGGIPLQTASGRLRGECAPGASGLLGELAAHPRV